MSQRLKGFIFGSLVMLITPALAIPSDPAKTEPAPPMPALQEQYFQLTYADAEAAIAEALASRGAGSKITVTMNRGDKNGDVIFKNSQAISVEIRGLRFDDKVSRFTANLVALSGDQVVSAVAASGRYDELVEVPVLKRSVKAGEVISMNDIELRDYTAARTRMDTITDMASLIGKSPLRVISPGRPVREHELAQPTMIKKNDLVTMHYQIGGMKIATQGQALEDAPQGGVVPVRNVASKKTVQARVQDAMNVIIDGMQTQTSAIDSGAAYETN